MALFLGLDFSYVLPAVLFTLLAVILGSSFFKKPKPSKKKEDDAARVERTEKVEHFQPKVELPEVAPIVEHKEEKVEQKEAESVAVAPVVEEMGVVEEQPVIEPETTEIQEPAPEPEPEAEPEPTPKPAPEEEPVPELIPGDIEDIEPESLDKPQPEEEPVGEHNDDSAEHDLSPKYSPGKKRTTQFEEMMTKEELEEEQSMEE